MDPSFNSMQASVGLSPDASAPQFMPTPPVTMPPTRHPGEVSQLLAYRATMAAAIGTGVVPTAFNPENRGIYNPAAAYVNPGGDPYATFGNSYATNRELIRARRFAAYGPYGGAGGSLPGFDMTMMPAPAQMSDPNYGIYRQNALPRGAYFSGYGLPQEPLLPPPYYQGLARSQFGMASDRSQALTDSRLAQLQAALAGVSAYTGADAVLGGGHKNLFTNLAERTQYIKNITAGSLLGGAELSGRGYGLGEEGATAMAQFIRKHGAQYTSGFNAADFGRILNEGGKAGLFEGPQSGTDPKQQGRTIDDVKSKLLNVASTLKKFMQVVNEPDVVEAIRELGRMKTMGLSLTESMSAAQNSRMFARMAGTTLKAMTAAGQAGAMTFQGIGLTAGLGDQVGQASIAFAKQAANSGTFTPQQLALLGGVSGAGQRLTDATAATLKIPMLAASVSKLGKGGTFTLDLDKLQDLVAGKMDLEGMARSASDNLESAVARGGPEALGMYYNQESELQDQVGRALGPVRLQMLMLSQVKQTMHRLGMRGPGGYMTAANVMYKNDPETARMLAMFAANPENFTNLRRQLDVKGVELSADQYLNTENSRIDEATRRSNLYRTHLRKYAEIPDELMSEASYIGTALNRHFSRASENFSDSDVGTVNIRYRPVAYAENEAQKRTLRQLKPDDILAAMYDHRTGRNLKQALQFRPGYDSQFLGNDPAMMQYMRYHEGRRGGLPMFLRRLGNTLERDYFDHTGLMGITGHKADTPEQVEAKLKDYAVRDRFGEAVGTQTATGRKEAFADLAKLLGGEDKAEALLRSYAGGLRSAAIENRGGQTDLATHQLIQGTVAGSILLGTAGATVASPLAVTGVGAVVPVFTAKAGAVAGGFMGYGLTKGYHNLATHFGSEAYFKKNKEISAEQLSNLRKQLKIDEKTEKLLWSAVDRTAIDYANPNAISNASAADATGAMNADKITDYVSTVYKNLNQSLFAGKGSDDEGNETIKKLFLENDVEFNDHAAAKAALGAVERDGTDEQKAAATAMLKEYEEAHNLSAQADAPVNVAYRNMLARIKEGGDTSQKQLRTYGELLLEKNKNAKDLYGMVKWGGDKARGATGIAGYVKAASEFESDLVPDGWGPFKDNPLSGLLMNKDKTDRMDVIASKIREAGEQNLHKLFKKGTPSYISAKRYLDASRSSPGKADDNLKALTSDIITRDPVVAETKGSVIKQDANVKAEKEAVSQVADMMKSVFPNMMYTFRESTTNLNHAASELRHATKRFGDVTFLPIPRGDSSAIRRVVYDLAQ